MHKFAVLLTSYVPCVCRCSAGVQCRRSSLCSYINKPRGSGGRGRGVGEALTQLTIPLPLVGRVLSKLICLLLPPPTTRGSFSDHFFAS